MRAHRGSECAEANGNDSCPDWRAHASLSRRATQLVRRRACGDSAGRPSQAASADAEAPGRFRRLCPRSASNRQLQRRHCQTVPPSRATRWLRPPSALPEKMVRTDEPRAVSNPRNYSWLALPLRDSAGCGSPPAPHITNRVGHASSLFGIVSDHPELFRTLPCDPEHCRHSTTRSPIRWCESYAGAEFAGQGERS